MVQFRWLIVLLPLAGCVGEATVDVPGEESAADALRNGVVVQLPAALGGGTVTTHLSPSTEPTFERFYGVPSPEEGAPWPGSPAPADMSATALSLPPSADVSGWAPPAGNQGHTSSCQSWATAYSAMGWWANYSGLTNAQFAPMYVYSQMVQGNCNQGGTIEKPLSIIQSQGIDTLNDYQPNQGNLDCGTQPTAAQTANAGNFKITGYTRVNLSAGLQPAIMSTIAAGHPAILRILAYREFDNARPNNLLIGAPQAGDPPGAGHMVTAFSYDAQGVWVLNSWGTGWGSAGWAELSWAFVNGSFNGHANIADVVDISGVNFACSDSDAQCAGWAATNQCQANPGYMLTHCCASCANPAPCANNAANCAPLTFTFQPLFNTNSCMDVYQDASANLTQIEEYTCNGGGAQNFSLVDQGNGLVSLRHNDSGKCVDVYRQGTANGTRVELYACNNTAAQQFQIGTDFGGSVTLWNPHSGKCLDVAGSNPADLTKIQLWDCNNTNAQKWWMTAH